MQFNWQAGQFQIRRTDICASIFTDTKTQHVTHFKIPLFESASGCRTNLPHRGPVKRVYGLSDQLCSTTADKSGAFMNIPVLIVACITLLAFIAHLFGGTRETAAIAPSADNRKLTAHWVQAMCAFQMLAVDLLFVSGLLFALVFMDFGAVENTILLVLSLLYFLWGIVWVVQLVWLKAPGATLLRLPHWLVWFVCAGLLFWGA